MNHAPFAVPPLLTDESEQIASLWWVFVWIAAGICVLVAGLLLWCIVRYRRRDDRLPRQTRQHIPMEVAYTVTPLLIVIGLVVATFVTVDAIGREDEPDLVVDVIGFQWQWQFEYPESGVVVTGTADDHPELVLPANSTVRFRLDSLDVIHSFWVPGFRFKRDFWPGEVQEFDVRVLGRTGVWHDGACAEFCGLDHATMRFSIRVVEPDEFERWLAAAPDEPEAAS